MPIIHRYLARVNRSKDSVTRIAYECSPEASRSVTVRMRKSPTWLMVSRAAVILGVIICFASVRLPAIADNLMGHNARKILPCSTENQHYVWLSVASVLIVRTHPGNVHSVAIRNLSTGVEAPMPWLERAIAEKGGDWSSVVPSPNGRWLAFCSIFNDNQCVIEADLLTRKVFRIKVPACNVRRCMWLTSGYKLLCFEGFEEGTDLGSGHNIPFTRCFIHQAGSLGVPKRYLSLSANSALNERQGGVVGDSQAGWPLRTASADRNGCLFISNWNGFRNARETDNLVVRLTDNGHTTRKFHIQLPENQGIADIAIHPDGKHVAWLLYINKPTHTPEGKLHTQQELAICISTFEGKSMRTVMRMPTSDWEVPITKLSWLPGSPQLSFDYAGITRLIAVKP